jgi:hypothetical protein
LRVGVLAALICVAGACDAFDQTIQLSQQTFTLDFGQQSGTMPSVACADAPAACTAETTVGIDTSSMTGVPSNVEVAVGCDGGSGLCYAQATTRAAQTLGVLQGDDLGDKIGRKGLSFVERVNIAYTIPSNTLTFDIPQIDIYAGPAGSTRETDPGVATVGSTPPITAGTTTSEPQVVTINDDTPARPVIENAIEDKQNFVFILVATPRMTAGSTIPAGTVQVDVFPSVTVGLPR